MLVCQWDTVQCIVFYYERAKEVHHKNDECFSLYNTDYVALCTQFLISWVILLHLLKINQRYNGQWCTQKLLGIQKLDYLVSLFTIRIANGSNNLGQTMTVFPDLILVSRTSKISNNLGNEDCGQKCCIGSSKFQVSVTTIIMNET